MQEPTTIETGPAWEVDGEQDRTVAEEAQVAPSASPVPGPSASPVPSPSASSDFPEPSRGVTVSIKPQKQYNIEIDPDKLRWEHLAIIQKAQADGLGENEAGEAFFDLLRALTGENLREHPLRVVMAVINQLNGIAQGIGEKKS